MEAQIICIQLRAYISCHIQSLSVTVQHSGLPESIPLPGKNTSSLAEKHFLKPLTLFPSKSILIHQSYTVVLLLFSPYDLLKGKSTKILLRPNIQVHLKILFLMINL